MANENSSTKSDLRCQNNDKKYRENRQQESKKAGIQEYRNIRNQESDYRPQSTESHQPPASSGQHPSKDFPDSRAPISEKLRELALNHNWETVGPVTNQLKFRRTFGNELENLIIDHENSGKSTLANRIKACHEKIMRLCAQIDTICRRGCTTEEEMEDLEQIYGKTKKTTHDLADLIDGCCRLPNSAELSKRDQGRMLAENQRTPPQRIVEIPAAEKQQSAQPVQQSIQIKNVPIMDVPDMWISYDDAAELMGMTKSTVSKWAGQGRFSDNGQKGQNRRLSRLSVILANQQHEEKMLKRFGKKKDTD